MQQPDQLAWISMTPMTPIFRLPQSFGIFFATVIKSCPQNSRFNVEGGSKSHYSLSIHCKKFTSNCNRLPLLIIGFDDHQEVNFVLPRQQDVTVPYLRTSQTVKKAILCFNPACLYKFLGEGCMVTISHLHIMVCKVVLTTCTPQIQALNPRQMHSMWFQTFKEIQFAEQVSINKIPSYYQIRVRITSIKISFVNMAVKIASS